jgi:hypothetical protein
MDIGMLERSGLCAGDEAREANRQFSRPAAFRPRNEVSMRQPAIGVGSLQ